MTMEKSQSIYYSPEIILKYKKNNIIYLTLFVSKKYVTLQQQKNIVYEYS